MIAELKKVCLEAVRSCGECDLQRMTREKIEAIFEGAEELDARRSAQVSRLVQDAERVQHITKGLLAALEHSMVERAQLRARVEDLLSSNNEFEARTRDARRELMEYKADQEIHWPAEIDRLNRIIVDLNKDRDRGAEQWV